MKDLLMAGTASRFFPFGLLAVLLLAGCGDHDGLPDPPMPDLPPPGHQAQVNPAALTAPRLDAVLLAGDASRSVYNIASLELRARLEAVGTPIERLHALSAENTAVEADIYQPPAGPGAESQHRQGAGPAALPARRKLPGGTDPATRAYTLQRLLGLDGKRGGACLVYLVTTPTEDGAGLTLKRGSLSPDDLDRALSGGCADAPTILVISACNSGAFALPPVARPNRLILTASAVGRSGFGCGPNAEYTTFDECFLGALDTGPLWRDIFAATRTCVQRREKLVGQASVEPQIALGAAVAALPAPFQAALGGPVRARQVLFSQGVGRFSTDDAPYFPVLRSRVASALQHYAAAPSPKALALTFAGTVIPGISLNDTETPEDIARIALERCEWESGGACLFYARGMDLAAPDSVGVTPLHPTMLVRQGRFSPGITPFITDKQREQLGNYANLPGDKAIALGPDTESLGIGQGRNPAEAEQAALAACSHAGGSCVIFARGDQVVLGDHS